MSTYRFGIQQRPNDKMSEAMQTEWRAYPRVQLFMRKIKFPFHN